MVALGKHQFQNSLSHLLEFVGLVLHFGALENARCTARHEVAVYPTSTNAARTFWFDSLIMTEGRNVDAVTPGRRKDRNALLGHVVFSVDFKLHQGCHHLPPSSSKISW